MPLTECDKSFTRSDALAKHMRLQHNVEAGAPGRGGNRKRKRDREEPARPSVSTASDPAGFSIFKIEPHTPSELHMPSEPGGTPAADDYFNGGRSPSPADEGIPSYLIQDRDPATGLIRGRAPGMVKYLVMKAKVKFALEQHSTLMEELRVLRAEECALRQGKDEALDSVMRMEFGWVMSFLSFLFLFVSVDVACTDAPRPAVDQLLSTAGGPSPQTGSYTPEAHAPPETHL